MKLVAIMSSLFNFLLLDIGESIKYAAKYCLAYLGLLIDGIGYTLVSYSFKIFLIICNINYNSLLGLASGLLQRVEALIIVFIVYKLGVSFIKYMLNPDKFREDGTKLLKNLFITAALLVSYSFVFSVFNELSILIMGNQVNYKYTTLSQVFDLNDVDGEGKKDDGLILRLIYGSSVDVETKDTSDKIALGIAGAFIRNYNGNDIGDSYNLEGDLNCTDENGCNFGLLPHLASKVSGELGDENGEGADPPVISYVPILGLLVSLFVAYSLFKACIDIGIRMFKLVVLQLLAPIVFITIIGEGVEKKLFPYVKLYLSVFLSAFSRMITILLISVFVGKFASNINDYFPTLVSRGGGFTKSFVLIIIILAAYSFLNQLPKFIDQILGTKLADQKSTMNFAGGLLGAGLGAIGGFAAGLATGGIGAAVGNTVIGAGKGAMSGGKGQKISEVFKGNSEVQKANRERARSIYRQGGLRASIGNEIERRLPIRQSIHTRIDNIKDRSTAFNNMMDTRAAVLEFQECKETYTDENGNTVLKYTDAKGEALKFGKSADEFASKVLENNEDVLSAYAKLQAAQEKGNSDEILKANKIYLETKERVSDEAKEVYNRSLFTNSTVNTDIKVQEATKLNDSMAREDDKKSTYFTKLAQAERKHKEGAPEGVMDTEVSSAIKSATVKGPDSYAGQQKAEESKAPLRREGRQDIFGGGKK